MLQHFSSTHNHNKEPFELLNFIAQISKAVNKAVD